MPRISADQKKEVEGCYPRLDRLVLAARVKKFSETLHLYFEDSLSKRPAGVVVDFIHAYRGL